MRKRHTPYHSTPGTRRKALRALPVGPVALTLAHWPAAELDRLIDQCNATLSRPLAGCHAARRGRGCEVLLAAALRARHTQA